MRLLNTVEIVTLSCVFIVELTTLPASPAMSSGWNPPARKSDFDLLPLLLQKPGQHPQVFVLPPEAVREVFYLYTVAYWSSM